MSVLLIDNYDSFTYNLYQALRCLTPAVSVFRNDAISVEEIARLAPTHIVISPGPGVPGHAGISKESIRRCAGASCILGVCLGHQCINEVFGGATVRAPVPFHGKTSTVVHDGQTIFAGLPQAIEVARYHSLVVDAGRISPELEISAATEDGIIMALRHRRYRIEGVQFHPESFLTACGEQILRNYFEANA
ncbi:MAG TPA: aminodeoxychorismate/anthranilate synthase component II [Bryobacteraceae bacterium]